MQQGSFNTQQQQDTKTKTIPNPQNYKIVKCKYWEKGNFLITTDGTCRYGTICTFAHGDTEIRSKTDNMLSQGVDYGNVGSMNMGVDPNMYGGMPYGNMDPNMLMTLQYMSMMGYDPMTMNMNPMMMNLNPMGTTLNPNNMSLNPNLSNNNSTNPNNGNINQ
jgi:hypothetical protein